MDLRKIPQGLALFCFFRCRSRHVVNKRETRGFAKMVRITFQWMGYAEPVFSWSKSKVGESASQKRILCEAGGVIVRDLVTSGASLQRG
jgi:hypothetical protein